ncbi:MAG: hypothetical protein M0R40_09020 [Firmicutes bacterium]|nr:hypothetical protein [Bacillota bacterium]
MKKALFSVLFSILAVIFFQISGFALNTYSEMEFDFTNDTINEMAVGFGKTTGWVSVTGESYAKVVKDGELRADNQVYEFYYPGLSSANSFSAQSGPSGDFTETIKSCPYIVVAYKIKITSSNMTANIGGDTLNAQIMLDGAAHALIIFRKDGVIYSGSTSTQIGTAQNPVFNAGGWNSIVQVIDTRTDRVNVYINGKLRVENFVVTGSYNNIQQRFGMLHNNGNAMTARIDDLLIYATDTPVTEGLIIDNEFCSGNIPVKSLCELSGVSKNCVTVRNLDVTPCNSSAVVFIAQYNANNALIDVVCGGNLAVSGYKTQFDSSFTVNNDTVKISSFIWNNADLLSPWTAPAVLTDIHEYEREIPGIQTRSEGGVIWTYPAYNNADSSPDYEITVQQQGGVEADCFAFYSVQESEYTMYDTDTGKAHTTYPNYEWPGEAKRNTTTIFSFDGAPVTVRIKVKPDAKHITVPLTSAKVLPGSYNIPCEIEDGDTIIFTLDRPEKVFVIPNYDIIWNKYAELADEHIPIQEWRDFIEQRDAPSFKGNNLTIDEGFLNPLVVLAHGKEQACEIPDRDNPKVLLVQPGVTPTEEQIRSYDIIWFTPGVHDLSELGNDPVTAGGNGPHKKIELKAGQKLYLEGGAYVMARFWAKRSGNNPNNVSVYGRGVLSGIKHKWVKEPNQCPLVDNVDEVSGITMTDPSGVAVMRTMNVADIALVGTWHYNITGVITTKGCVVENSLFMSDDDNVVLQTNTVVRHVVIWQQSNAHPLMEQGNAGMDYADTVVEDVDIVAWFRPTSTNPWHLVGLGAITLARGSYCKLENFAFKDIRIESPFLFRPFTIYNLDTNEITPGWFPITSEENHSRIKGIAYENISVNSPVIFLSSLIGSPYDNSIEDITFKNIVINGVKIDGANWNNYFEIDYMDGNVKGLKFE